MSEFLQLGEHISIQKGKPPLLIPFHGKGAEIYLSPEYLRNRTVGISAKASSDAVRVSDGATVLLWDGSNAGEFFKAKKGIVASTMARITPDANFYPAFFFYLLKHAERILKNQTNGTGIPHVDKEILENISAFCPGDSQQHKIAEVLDTLDTAIHQTEAIVDKLKQVKQGLLHDLLTRGVDSNGELRPSYEEAPELYQVSPCGWIPNAWKALGLADFAPAERSVIRTGPFGSSLKGEHWRESGRPVVTIGSLGIGRFIEEELLFVDELTARRLSEYELIPGDIVFSRVADVGRSVVVNEAQEGWIMSSNFMRISVNRSKVHPSYLQLLLAHSDRVRKQIRATVNSGGRDVANSAILMALLFPMPTPDEQGEIVNRNAVLSLRLEQESCELAKLLEVKAGLMDDLLTGRVRVTPLLAQ